jgi:hypothetical protein
MKKRRRRCYGDGVVCASFSLVTEAGRHHTIQQRGGCPHHDVRALENDCPTASSSSQRPSFQFLGRCVACCGWVARSTAWHAFTCSDSRLINCSEPREGARTSGCRHVRCEMKAYLLLRVLYQPPPISFAHPYLRRQHIVTRINRDAFLPDQSVC